MIYIQESSGKSEQRFINTNQSMIAMARPIEATPTLRGKDAIRFIRNMIKEERNPNPKRIAFLKRCEKLEFEVIY